MRKLNLSKLIFDFCSSWVFIVLFCAFIAVWIFLNLYIAHYDPYPFILLNLFLSCLAALQAPVILMQQKKLDKMSQEQQDKILELTMHIHDIAESLKNRVLEKEQEENIS